MKKILIAIAAFFAAFGILISKSDRPKSADAATSEVAYATYYGTVTFGDGVICTSTISSNLTFYCDGVYYTKLRNVFGSTYYSLFFETSDGTSVNVYDYNHVTKKGTWFDSKYKTVYAVSRSAPANIGYFTFSLTRASLGAVSYTGTTISWNAIPYVSSYGVYSSDGTQITTTTSTSAQVNTCGSYYVVAMDAENHPLFQSADVSLSHDYSKKAIWGRGENIASGSIYDCTDEVVAYYLCSHCNAIGTETFVYRAAGAHTWGAWETTTAATCTSTGVQKRYCATCAESETQTIAATGHSYGAWQTVTAATCTDNGSRVRECTACGDHQTETILATGHDYTKREILGRGENIASGSIYNCTEEVTAYYLCTRCNAIGTETFVYREAGSHDIQKFYDAPTCVNTGNSGERCVNCGYTVKSDILPALGHNFVDRVCTRCGIEADYIVIFYNHDGSKIVETTCEKGSTIDFPEDPERKGYSFAGWFWYDDTGEYVKVSKYLTVQSDMEIYAYFDAIKINVYITDSVTGKTTTYTVLDGYTLGESLRTVSHSGYRFTGYTRDGADIPFSASTPITEELHLTANYEITFFGKVLSIFKGLSVWTLVIIVVVIVLFLVLTKTGKSGSRRSSRRRRK